MKLAIYIVSVWGSCAVLNSREYPYNIAQCTCPKRTHNLKVLELASNKLTGRIPSMIFNNSNIESIQLYGNHLSGHLPSSIGLYLPNLQGLILWGNSLSGIIPSSICNASQVILLGLSENILWPYSQYIW